MKITLFILIIASLSLFGCSSTINKSQYSKSIDMSVSSRLNAEIDVDLQNELTGYAYGGFLFHFIKITGDKKYADGIDYGNIGSNWGPTSWIKSAAAYNALKNTKADVLVAPRYVIEESSNPFYREIKVKVVGYPGKIRSIRNMQMNVNRLELDKVTQ